MSDKKVVVVDTLWDAARTLNRVEDALYGALELVPEDPGCWTAQDCIEELERLWYALTTIVKHCPDPLVLQARARVYTARDELRRYVTSRRQTSAIDALIDAARAAAYVNAAITVAPVPADVVQSRHALQSTYPHGATLSMLQSTLSE